jgi:hypothetical protein
MPGGPTARFTKVTNADRDVAATRDRVAARLVGRELELEA